MLKLWQVEHFVQYEDVRPVDGGITTVQADVSDIRKAALAGAAVRRILFDVGDGVRPGVSSLDRGEVAQLRAEHHLKRVVAGVSVAAEEVDCAEVGCRPQRVDARRGVAAGRRGIRGSRILPPDGQAVPTGPAGPVVNVEVAALPAEECTFDEIAVRNLVDVVGAGLVDRGVADVTDADNGIARQLLFDGQIPLPGIRRNAAVRPSSRRRGRCAGQRNCSVERAIDAARGDGERRSVGQTDLRADAFTLIELASTDTQSGLAGSENVPGNAEARSDVVVVVVTECAVDARGSSAQR